MDYDPLDLIVVATVTEDMTATATAIATATTIAIAPNAIIVIAR